MKNETKNSLTFMITPFFSRKLFFFFDNFIMFFYSILKNLDFQKKMKRYKAPRVYISSFFFSLPHRINHC